MTNREDRESIMKTKRVLKGLGLTIAIMAALGWGILILANKTKENLENKKNKTPKTGLTWIDENKREYAGIVRNFYRGADQKIYIDRKPFGSLEGVRVKAYSDNGKSYEVDERQPESGEVDTFLLLQDYAKKEHPALFSKYK